MLRQSISLSLAIGFVLLDATHLAGFAQSVVPSQPSARPDNPSVPAGPRSPRPAPGRRRPGGGLSGGNQCPMKVAQLTAILPGDAQGSTRSGQTTFWFYVPYSETEVSFGEFSLSDREGKKTLYNNTFTLPATPGFVSITLPNDIAPLQTDEYYQWFLNLYCTANTSSTPDLKVNGWVVRLSQASMPDSRDQNAPPALWYDRVNDLATQLQKSPQDANLRQQWTTLLTQLGLAELAKEPIVSPAIIVEEKP